MDRPGNPYAPPEASLPREAPRRPRWLWTWAAPMTLMLLGMFGYFGCLVWGHALHGRETIVDHELAAIGYVALACALTFVLGLVLVAGQGIRLAARFANTLWSTLDNQ